MFLWTSPLSDRKVLNNIPAGKAARLLKRECMRTAKIGPDLGIVISTWMREINKRKKNEKL